MCTLQKLLVEQGVKTGQVNFHALFAAICRVILDTVYTAENSQFSGSRLRWIRRILQICACNCHRADSYRRRNCVGLCNDCNYARQHTDGHSVLPLLFRSFFLSFFLYSFFRRLNSEFTWLIVIRHQTLSRLMVTQIYGIRSEIWGLFSRNLTAQKHEILARFRTNFAI